MTYRGIRIILVAGLALFTSVETSAQQEKDQTLIEAQALGSALQVLAEEYDLQVLFESAVVANHTAQAIPQGTSRDAALGDLLSGTDLTYEFVNERTVAIRGVEEEAVVGHERGASDSKNSPPTPVLTAQNQTPPQETPTSPSQAITNEVEDDDEVLEQIIVTGSRIRGAQSASPVVTITRDEIDLAGYATVEEVVENLPQNFGAGVGSRLDTTNTTLRADVVGNDVSSPAGGTSINLRGLGASSTLVLLNGRRTSPSGLRAGFTNIGSIPVTAIERVEVMTDGASAIYGADAIAGVINFILREDHEGAETRLRYGSDSGGDTSDLQIGQTFGTSWGSGNVLFTYEFYETEALASTDRAFTASSDLTDFGGTDWRRPGGTPANIFAGGQVFAIPDGQDGTSLTPADFVGTEGLQNLFNEREVIDLLPDLDRHSAFLHLKQSAGGIDLFAAARYANEESSRRNDVATIFSFTVTDASPWFVDPTDTGLTQLSVRNYSITKEAGSIDYVGEIDTFGATMGAEVEFFNNWSGALTLNWSKEEALNTLNKGLDSAARVALAASVNNSDPALAFNPFSDGSNSSNRAILEQLFTSPFPQTSYENELQSANFDINGDLNELGGGTAQLAVGAEFRRESLSSVAGILSAPRESDLSRDIRAVYAELFLPIVGQGNRRRGLNRLEISLAARYEDYTDFGSSTNPKVGVLWSPVQTLLLKGTFGTSFRAPSLINLDETQATATFYVPPAFFGSSLIATTGNNASLQAEEATTWTAGIQWKPDSVDDLTLDLTYFDVGFTDRIEQPIRNTAAALADPAMFQTFVILNPTPEQIARFVDDPAFLEGRFAPGSADDFISGAIPVDVILNNRLTNLAESDVTGIELQLSYARELNSGTFSAGLNGNYLFDYERRLLPTDPLVDEVDTFGRPVDLRVRGNASWNRNSWSISGFVNYTDGYTDNGSSSARPGDPQAVDSWTTVDITIAYQTGINSGFMSDTRVSLTTQNVFDQDPPFVDTRGGVGYDAVNANPIGRFFAFQLSKNW